MADLTRRKVNALTTVSDIQTGDKLVGERTNGTTVLIPYVAPTSGVSSVNGETGAVTITSDDISTVAQTNKFVTAADVTKLSNLSGTNTGDQTISLTGDVTGSGTGSFAATIANDSVTYAKIQNVSATDKLLGRSTAGAGDVEEITCTSAGRALIDDATAADQRTTLGLGTLATQSGTFSGTSSGTNTGDQTITLTGGVTGSGTGSFATTVVTNANLTGPVTSVGNATTIADAELAALAGLTSAADKVPYFTGSGTAALADLSSNMRTFMTTPSSANLAALLSDETGTGANVFAQSPALLQPTADNFIDGFTSTATAAGTTTLTVTSNQRQTFTGSTTQTCKLPVVSTLVLGTCYMITNLSSGVVTVQSSGANTIQAMAANTTIVVQSNATTGTGASVWNVVLYTAAASDITGSGSLVRATSPTFVTPTLGAATATSLTFNPTTGGIVGTTTNDVADAGKVGEIISSTVAFASAVSMTSTVAANVTSISLTAGDWEISSSVGTDANTTTTISRVYAAVSTTSATMPSYPGTIGSQGSGVNLLQWTTAADTDIIATIPNCTLKLSGTTTVYLVANYIFATSTLKAYGAIVARRVR